MTAELDVAGERLVLRPDRTLFWPARRTLVLADPHFGKTAAFRSFGVPVPGGSGEPLARLSAAVADTGAERLVVLGDFWHAWAGRTPDVTAGLTDWRQAHPSLHIELVRGNHDRAGPPPAGWGDWHDLLADGPFVFAHHPEPAAGGYVLAGHLHPGVVLSGRGRQRLRLPAFWFSAAAGVLPAFGPFTGAMAVDAGPGDRLFAVADGEVIGVQ